MLRSLNAAVVLLLESKARVIDERHHHTDMRVGNVDVVSLLALLMASLSGIRRVSQHARLKGPSPSCMSINASNSYVVVEYTDSKLSLCSVE